MRQQERLLVEEIISILTSMNSTDIGFVHIQSRSQQSQVYKALMEKRDSDGNVGIVSDQKVVLHKDKVFLLRCYD